MSKVRKKKKMKKFFYVFLFILLVIIGLIIYIFFFSNGDFSNEVGELFDDITENITKSTEAYKTCMSEEVLKEEDLVMNLMRRKMK